MPIQPLPLKKGDSAALLAPASPAPDSALEAAVRSLELLGLKPVIMPSCTMSEGYLAGSDARRASDLNRAFSDPSIRGIFCLRGGYGASRILPLLDLEGIRSNPKVFVGYSDITALHSVFNRLCGFVTFHGPMAGEDYTLLDAYSLEILKKMIFSPELAGELKNPPGSPLQVLYPGRAEGILTGGNLTVLQSTLGSSYEIDTKGKILFLEDTGECPYRLDRALTSLALAGKFRDCAGILLGTFTGCGSDLPRLKDLFQERIAPWKKPALFNFHAGHIPSQCTLPLGMRASLRAGDREGSFLILKHTTR